MAGEPPGSTLKSRAVGSCECQESVVPLVQTRSARPQGGPSLLNSQTPMCSLPSTFTHLSQEAFWCLPTGVDATFSPLM